MLQIEEEGAAKEVAGFEDDGQRFFVRDKVMLENYLPKFFRHGKFNSFKRLLYMYNFERCSSEEKGEIYYHPEFDRNKPEKCQEMTRKNSTLALLMRAQQIKKQAQQQEEAEQSEHDGNREEEEEDEGEEEVGDDEEGEPGTNDDEEAEG